MKYIYKGACVLTLLLLVVACADKSELIARSWTIDLDAIQANAKLKNEADRAKLAESTKAMKNLIGEQVTYKFEADGTMTAASSPDLVRWKVADGKLLLMTKDGGFVKRVTIKKLTKNQLVLDFKDGKPMYLKAKK
ncbi:lipocalin-like domain-containing protein [Microscilla marina]|uniref:Lipoprotein, putative n=1 Tax=Microscilla marina ATCC 23134 TaxID=313606 RepID=A1ZEA3_MICM2|nr:hypothetical protein [Microscilla marina]EAY31411.1 lipoprotein, putative [Microscilla marina ATCC 23134]